MSHRAFPPIWTSYAQLRSKRRVSESDGPSVIKRAKIARREFLERFTLGPASRKRRNSESSPNDDAKRARLDTNDLLPIREDATQNGLGVLTEITLRATRRCTSLTKYLETLNVKLRKRLERLIAERRGLKMFYAIRIFYAKIRSGTARFEAFLHTALCRITSAAGIPAALQRCEDEILNRNANYMRNESGLIIDEIMDCRLSVATYAPLISGSSYAKLPAFLLNKKAIVNVHNTDNRCFGYAIISCLKSDKAYEKDRGQSKQYDKYFHMYGLDEVDYPVEIADIPALETKLKLSINVFSFYDDDGRARYPVYVSERNQKDATEIDLLYWKDHYAWIASFQRFMHDITNANRQLHFCKRCLCHYTSADVLKRHEGMCTGVALQAVVTMPPPGTKLTFKNERYLQKIPFVVYADFECLTKSIADADGDARQTTAYQAHVPCSVGLFVASTVDDDDTFSYETYTGTDVCVKFLQRICDIEELCVRYIFNDQRMIMTSADRVNHAHAKVCYVCEKPFDNSPADGDAGRFFNAKKVRDHDHATGKYRGAAHQTCNMRLRKTYKIPVIFHNFRGYDSHLLIAAFGKFKNRELGVIGQGIEKYLTINWGDHVVFKDSLQFLGASLDSLTSCLMKSGRDKFHHLLNAFKNHPSNKVDLLLKKGVYPYDYMNEWKKLDDPALPSIEAFASKLRGTDCDESDYARAQTVWNAFECKRMMDYHDLYLKTDVLQLADVFESFRCGSLENYKLDPAHYVSAPHLSWDAMLHMSKCNLQLLDDAEMFRMLENNLRGGISMITKRYARANNPRLGTLYDPAQPTSHIMYWDANNLYGWAMSQHLPYDEFRWMDEADYKDINWKNVPDDGLTGFIVECDLDYPTQTHLSHNDYPLAPEKVEVTVEMVSEKQAELHRHYAFNRSTVHAKLIPNLLPKTKYCCHYRNLKFYLTHGMTLEKVHRVLCFKQSRWLSTYIETNQNLRAAATDEFLKKLYKDMNNSCFGKTCENQKKRSDIKLVTDAQKCKKLIEKSHCKAFRIFTEDIAAVNLSKTQTLINRPFYVGFCVLELSKLHMYRFHYDVIKRIYPGLESQLLFTDTDSLMYQIFADDVYEKVWENKELFDLAGYPPDFFHDTTNNKVIGKFKDEANSEPILEFVGLRPKMYSYVTAKDVTGPQPKLSEKTRAKGIQRAAAALLRHQDFLEQLQNPHENYLANRRIGSKLHRLYTYRARKRGLCAFDDKRFICEDGITTLAYGNSKIRFLARGARDEVQPDRRAVLSYAEALQSRVRLQHQKELPPGLDPKNAFAEARKRKIDAVAEPVNDMNDLLDHVF